MKNGKTRVNLLFAGTIGLLAGFSLVYYFGYHTPAPDILPPAAAGLPPGHPNLPENHPPIDYAKELMTLQQMSRDDPQNADYKTRIGNIYYDTGQYRKAIEAYQQSLALRPKAPEVETDLATCFHYIGEHDKALELLENVLSYSPSFPQALFNKGVVLQSGKQDLKAAIAAWEELLRTNPGMPQRAELEQKIRQLRVTAP